MEPLSLLIVGGHPADAFDNAGGTLSHHVERGDRVTAAVLTHGARSHSMELIDDLRTGRLAVSEATDAVVQGYVDEKRREVLEAAAIMGITDIRFLEYQDDVLLLDEKLVIQIDEIIREVKPDIVITHYPTENAGLFGTHAVCAQATLHAIESAGGARRDTTHPPHHVAQVFFMGIPTAAMATTVLWALSPVFCPIFVDVTDAVEKKVRALDKLKSQEYQGAYARKRTEVNEGICGQTVRVPYAEPFVMYYPEVVRHLPVSDFLRQRSKETTEAQMARWTETLTLGFPKVFD